MSLFCCPICGAPLERLEQVYRCPNRHSYDIAAQGYTYLLPVSRKHSKAPGDDKAMSAARKAFLARDYYAPLQQTLCRLACDLAPQGAVRVLDSGCGEGYYTAALYHALAQTRKVQLAGIDISKFILRTAARRLKEGEFAVASAYHLPLAADSVDLLLDCFAPWQRRSSGGYCGRAGISCTWCRRHGTCGSSRKCSTTPPIPTRKSGRNIPAFPMWTWCLSGTPSI